MIVAPGGRLALIEREILTAHAYQLAKRKRGKHGMPISHLCSKSPLSNFSALPPDAFK